MTDAAFDMLLSHARTTAALARGAGVISWDQEVMMPPKGAAGRAETASALAEVLHERRTDPRIGEWLAAADRSALDATALRDLDLTARSYTRAQRVPAALAAHLAGLASRAQRVWADARKASDFAAFAPVLEEMIAARREEAQALAVSGQDPYDALLEEYEPDMQAATLDALFADLRAGLAPLAAEAAERRPAPAPTGAFPKEAQLALAREVATAFQYDWEAGRLDLAVHPFSSGHQGDARITTRVDEADPFNCLYSTIHEVGHAVYEQNIAADLFGRPSGAYASMGVHESQSRFFENQIGRSRAFAEWLAPRMRAHLPDAPADAEALFRAANRVHPGYIRTEADELHYNLHIMMRFDLERDLIAGRMRAAALPDAWTARFEADFGTPPPDHARGALQDVHWSLGLFGYFPTYSLGNLNAAALEEAMRVDLPDLEARMADGALAAPVAWLTDKVHRHGASLPAAALMEQATGRAVSAAPLLAHLRRKVDALA